MAVTDKANPIGIDMGQRLAFPRHPTAFEKFRGRKPYRKNEIMNANKPAKILWPPLASRIFAMIGQAKKMRQRFRFEV